MGGRKIDPTYLAAKARVEELADKGWAPAQIADEGHTGLDRSAISGIVFRYQKALTTKPGGQSANKRQSSTLAPPPPPPKAHAKRRNAINESRIEGERLKARAFEPELLTDAEIAPAKLRRHLGPSTHLSAKEKRERNLTHLDKDLVVGGGAFDGIDSDIAGAFAAHYNKLA